MIDFYSADLLDPALLVVWFSISSLAVQVSVVVVMDMIHIKIESKWKKMKNKNLYLSADSFSGFSLNMPFGLTAVKSSLVKLLPMFQKLFPSINQTSLGNPFTLPVNSALPYPDIQQPGLDPHIFSVGFS